MSNSKTKKQCQSIHMSSRLEERYGIKYTQFVRDSILCRIRAQKFKLVKKQSNRVSVFDVTIIVRKEDLVADSTYTDNTLTIRVVYDKHRKNLVSALPINSEIVSELEQ